MAHTYAVHMLGILGSKVGRYYSLETLPGREFLLNFQTVQNSDVKDAHFVKMYTFFPRFSIRYCSVGL